MKLMVELFLSTRLKISVSSMCGLCRSKKNSSTWVNTPPQAGRCKWVKEKKYFLFLICMRFHTKISDSLDSANAQSLIYINITKTWIFKQSSLFQLPFLKSIDSLTLSSILQASKNDRPKLPHRNRKSVHLLLPPLLRPTLQFHRRNV